MPGFLGTGQEVFANSTAGVVTSGGTTAPSAGTVQSLTVTVTTAFPAASTAATPDTFFYVSDPAAPSELILVTSAPGGTGAGQAWTVTRGAQGTTPVAHAGGFTVTQVITADTLQNMQSLPWFNVVTMYGADNTGVTDCGAAVATALANIPPQGAIVYFPAGKYLNAATTWTVNLTPIPEQVVTFVGDGMRTTVINYQGTGDCFRLYCSSTGALNYGGSGFRELCVDGTGSGSGACGIHVGDFELLEVERCQVTNFSGTGAIGIHFDNAYTWTEEATVRMSLINNTTAAMFEVTTGNVSWGYSAFDFNIWMRANQDGIVLKNGATVYHGTLRIRGNTDASASAMSNAVLRFTGTSGAGAQGGAGQPCQMYSELLIIQVEQIATFANVATTIVMDATAHAWGLTGILSFSYGGAAYNPASLSSIAQFAFTGVINGDATLCPAAVYDQWVWASTTPVTYFAGFAGSPLGYSGSGFPTFLGDMFTWTLTGNITANLTSTFYNGTKTLGAPQRVTIIIKQAASGGPYTVTWPVSGTPTTALPTIIWPGGTAPKMSTAPGAVDVYTFETTDGATWYGQARQQGDYLPDAEQFAALTAAYTLSNVTTAQKLFNATANGALLASGSTSYFFECEFDVTGLSASAHTLSFGFGGTATFTSARYRIESNTGAAGTLAAWNSAVFNVATASVFTASVTTTTAQARARGVIRVNAAGTVIPQITQNTASAAAIVGVNSWFRLWPVGPDTVASVGSWS